MDPTCRLCNQEEETVTHFLITCNALQNARKALLEDITHRCRELLDYININIDIDIARVIANQLIIHPSVSFLFSASIGLDRIKNNVHQ
jgi:hypothetical protein